MLVGLLHSFGSSHLYIYIYIYIYPLQSAGQSQAAALSFCSTGGHVGRASGKAAAGSSRLAA